MTAAPERLTAERVIEWVRSGPTLDELQRVAEAIREQVRGVSKEVGGSSVQ